MQTQAIDDPALDDDVTAHRERAKERLSQIAEQTKQVLAEHGIDTSVFFLIPHTGDAIVTFGTSLNPSDHEWNRVTEVVSAIVRQTVGLDHTRCREVVCATTADLCQPSAADGTAR
jgi:hypothetical protein